MKGKYIYPCLETSHDWGFIRFGGSGLANCMFIAARAYGLAKKYNISMLNPTWEKFSIGPYIRKEKDKRNYFGLFYKFGISGFKKMVLINRPSFSEDLIDYFENASSGVLKVVGLRNYFQDLDPYESQKFFEEIVKPNVLSVVNATDFTNKVAVHVRLGDYSNDRRVSLEWYKGIIKSLLEVNKSLEFLLFSDGTDEELKLLLDLSQTKRIYFGNALSDMFAISRCRLVVASDSTFSAWGAFLGQKPIIFSKRHFPPIYTDKCLLEFVVGEMVSIPDKVKNVLSIS